MKVLLAQFRKPACETRFYDKIGAAIAASGYTVLSAGNDIPSSANPGNPIIKLLPIFSSRAAEDGSVVKDLLLLWQVINNEKPDFLIYTSPEIGLLLPLLRLCSSTKIIFDIQENHFLNIKKQHFSDRKGRLHSFMARILVQLGLKFSHRIWLAERIYETQLPIPANKATSIENKAGFFPRVNPELKQEGSFFCFSGFISRESGVIRAINFIKVLRKHRPEIKLRIHGYCPDKKLRDEIQQEDFVEFKNPHLWASAGEIHQTLRDSLGILMPYYETESNAGKTPSKWFDALSLHKPVLIPLHTKFNLPRAESMSFSVDFQNPEENNFESILHFIDNWSKVDSLLEEEKEKWRFDPLPVQLEILRLSERLSFS